jgi:sodium/bile acid cotransporter 7
MIPKTMRLHMANSMLSAVRKNWFLVGLVVLIPLALVLASSQPPVWFVDAAQSVPTSICTAAILFLISVTLNSRRLFDSLRKPLPVLTACGVNQIVIPLLCFPMLVLQKSADLRVGLLIAASVPCTMAAASVWTRRAEGNDAVSLLVTLITNGLCFLITPLWLLAGSTWFGTADASGSLQFGSLVGRLVLAALLPAFVGQMVRLSQPVERFVDANKPVFSNIAQSVILMLVFVSAFRGGIQFETTGMSRNLRHHEFVVVWGCCIVLHVLAMCVIWKITELTGFAEEDRRACVFAGSQKTLPIGILISQATGMPFSILPMLMYHMSQLFIDTWIADLLRVRATQPDQ